MNPNQVKTVHLKKKGLYSAFFFFFFENKKYVTDYTLLFLRGVKERDTEGEWWKKAKGGRTDRRRKHCVQATVGMFSLEKPSEGSCPNLCQAERKQTQKQWNTEQEPVKHRFIQEENNSVKALTCKLSKNVEVVKGYLIF